jgi:prefoldin subunit 5
MTVEQGDQGSTGATGAEATGVDSGASESLSNAGANTGSDSSANQSLDNTNANAGNNNTQEVDVNTLNQRLNDTRSFYHKREQEMQNTINELQNQVKGLSPLEEALRNVYQPNQNQKPQMTEKFTQDINGNWVAVRDTIDETNNKIGQLDQKYQQVEGLVQHMQTKIAADEAKNYMAEIDSEYKDEFLESGHYEQAQQMFANDPYYNSLMTAVKPVVNEQGQAMVDQNGQPVYQPVVQNVQSVKKLFGMFLDDLKADGKNPLVESMTRKAEMKAQQKSMHNTFGVNHGQYGNQQQGDGVYQIKFG